MKKLCLFFLLVSLKIFGQNQTIIADKYTIMPKSVSKKSVLVTDRGVFKNRLYIGTDTSTTLEGFYVATDSRFDGRIKLGASFGLPRQVLISNGNAALPQWSDLQWSDIKNTPPQLDIWVKNLMFSNNSFSWQEGNTMSITPPLLTQSLASTTYAPILQPVFVTDASSPRFKVIGAGDIGKGSDLVMAGNSNDLTIHGTGKVILGTGGFQRLVVTNTGLIGIGTPLPQAKFEVSGTDGFRYNDAYQADGKYLRSNATGIARWGFIQHSEIVGLADVYMPKAGGAFTGSISATNLSGSNTGDNAVNSLYSGLASSKLDVTAAASTYLPLSGGTLTGNLNILSNNLGTSPKLTISKNGGDAGSTASWDIGIAPYYNNTFTIGNSAYQQAFNISPTGRIGINGQSGGAYLDVSGDASIDALTLPNSINGVLKTDGSGNVSASKLINTDVSSTANIDASKLGTGIISNSELNTLDGASSNLQNQISSKQNTLTAGQGIQISSNVISSVVTADTTTMPLSGGYRLALTADSVFKVVNSTGKVYDMISRESKWVLQPTVIDSTLSSYTVVDNKALNFLVSNVQSFSNASLGKYKTYTSNLHYYLPKHTPNYTITINLPNPALTSSDGLQINLTMNKRCTINFNYPIYYTIRNGVGGLTQDTDYGSTQMTPNLQTIPNTNFKASWFVSHDSSIFTFYVYKQKWYIK